MDVHQHAIAAADGRLHPLLKNVPLLEEALEELLDCRSALEVVAARKLRALAPHRLAVQRVERSLHVPLVEGHVGGADRVEVRLGHVRNDYPVARLVTLAGN